MSYRESILAADILPDGEIMESPENSVVGGIRAQTGHSAKKIGRRRAKHIPIKKFSEGSPEGFSGNSSSPPSDGQGDGPGGDGGGGSGKKPALPTAFVPADSESEDSTKENTYFIRLSPSMDLVPDSGRGNVRFTLGGSISPEVKSWLYGYISTQSDKAGADEPDKRPENKEVDDEASIDTALSEWAAKNDVEYFTPSGYAQEHKDFVKAKFFNHATRNHKIKQVKEQIAEHITILRMFQLNIRTAAPRAHLIKSDDMEAMQAALPAILKSALDMLFGSMPEASKDLIRDELDQIVAMVERMKTAYDRDLEMKIIKSAKNLEGVLRYRMEARDGTYRSINLTPDSLRQILGFEGMDEMLLGDSGKLKRIVDYGSGDGQLMIMLASALPAILKSKAYETAYASIQERCLREFGTTDIDKIFHGRYRPIERRALDEAYVWRDSLLKQVKDRFICVDQAPLFIERLTDRKGVGGVAADLCLPTDRFIEVSGIEPGSVQLGISSLTIDRASDVEQLVANISATLADDAPLVLLTKSSHSAKSDGVVATADPHTQIEYSFEKDLKGRTRIQLLDHLKPLLERHGLKIESVGRHNGKVISSDVSNNMVQNYKLLAIVCRKTPAGEEIQENIGE